MHTSSTSSKKTYRNLQIRKKSDEFWEKPIFQFRGQDIMLMCESPNCDMIPESDKGVPFRIPRQFIAQTSDGNVCDVYTYTYTDFYGTVYTVMDAVRI